MVLMATSLDNCILLMCKLYYFVSSNTVHHTLLFSTILEKVVFTQDQDGGPERLNKFGMGQGGEGSCPSVWSNRVKSTLICIATILSVCFFENRKFEDNNRSVGLQCHCSNHTTFCLVV